jgi:hypothetical protein
MDKELITKYFKDVIFIENYNGVRLPESQKDLANFYRICFKRTPWKLLKKNG